MAGEVPAAPSLQERAAAACRGSVRAAPLTYTNHTNNGINLYISRENQDL